LAHGEPRPDRAKTLTVALEDLKLVAKEMKEAGLSPESLLGKHVDWYRTKSDGDV
jgi:hypothetical protein